VERHLTDDDRITHTMRKGIRQLSQLGVDIGKTVGVMRMVGQLDHDDERTMRASEGGDDSHP